MRLELSYASANKELIEMKHDLVNLNRELNRRDFLISVLKMKLEAYEVTVLLLLVFYVDNDQMFQPHKSTFF